MDGDIQFLVPKLSSDTARLLKAMWSHAEVRTRDTATGQMIEEGFVEAWSACVGNDVYRAEYRLTPLGRKIAQHLTATTPPHQEQSTTRSR